MLYFEDCDISINGTGILVESAGLNSEAPIASLGTIGQNPFHYVPAGLLQNTLQLSYLLEPTREPNWQIISGFKTITTNTALSPVTIKIAGISGNFYLNDYSITTRENDLVGASVNYIGFAPLSGQISERDVTITYDFNSGSGIAHYCTSAIGMKRWRADRLLNQWYLSKNIYNCNYSFRANLMPVVCLGYQTPKSIEFLGAEETISVVHDQFIPLGVYGFDSTSGLQLPLGTYPQYYVDFFIRFGPVSEKPLAPLDVGGTFNLDCAIGLTGGLIKAEQMSISTNDMLRVNTTIIKSY